MRRCLIFSLVVYLVTMLTLQTGPARATDGQVIRVATYNAALNRPDAQGLLRDLRGGTDPQARAIAEIIQSVRPDILLINEIDSAAGDRAADLFRRAYLAVGQNGQAALDYRHLYVPTVNTGVPSGFDLDGDGRADGPGDAWGFGQFPGQYGMALFSRFPIEAGAIRSFQTLRWRDMPGALLDLADAHPLTGPGGFYGADAAEALRLSSKTHADVPIRIGETRLHLLISHPTPPVFDGPEDRNGKRNHDEIRFWGDYVSGAGWMTDDAGTSGGLPEGARFVIAGDLNADPFDGNGRQGAIRDLLDHPAVLGSAIAPEVTPARPSAPDAGDHQGNPGFDTADFRDPPGDLRVDYVLPGRAGLGWRGGAVVWPPAGAPLAEAARASDHRLVWIDLEIQPLPE